MRQLGEELSLAEQPQTVKQLTKGRSIVSFKSNLSNSMESEIPEEESEIDLPEELMEIRNNIENFQPDDLDKYKLSVEKKK